MMSSSISKPKNQSSTVAKPENEILPNWLELPEDMWLRILSMLRTLDIIQHVEQVCMRFSELCHHPSLFKVIDMYISSSESYYPHPHHYNSLTCVAVDRSAHKLADVYLDRHCTEDTLMFVVERSKNLKRLRLRTVEDISPGGLLKVFQNLPKLEELQLIVSSLPADIMEDVGRSCPSLRSFSLSRPKTMWQGHQTDALSIAKCMPHLRNLQLLGSKMTDEGLEAILDGCPHLESLDIRGCSFLNSFLINLSGPLSKRCERIKYFLSPKASTNCYSMEGTPYYEWSILPEMSMDDLVSESRRLGFYDDDSGYDYDDGHGGYADYEEDDDNLDYSSYFDP